ncbi:MAG TPA: Fic family protein, partial [Variovorax sp.]|nr:Fic family protein [Variovorax sp.]
MTFDELLETLAALASDGHEHVSSAQVAKAAGSSLPSVKRMLSKLLADQRIEVTGKARATRYRLLAPGASAAVGKTAAQ